MQAWCKPHFIKYTFSIVNYDTVLKAYFILENHAYNVLGLVTFSIQQLDKDKCVRYYKDEDQISVGRQHCNSRQSVLHLITTVACVTIWWYCYWNSKVLEVWWEMTEDTSLATCMKIACWKFSCWLSRESSTPSLWNELTLQSGWLG